MRKDKRGSNFGASNRFAGLEKSASGNNTRRVRRGKSRVGICMLAFLLLVLSALISLTVVNNAYAQSDCILLCPPTPTPSPAPSPTPSPMPSPTPRPKPTPTPTPSAVATPKPSVTASASPVATAVSTEVAPPPARNSAHIPPVAQKSSGNQAGKSGWLHFVVIAGIVVLVLLLSLEFGWLVVRRALLPQANGKLPPSGARPWSRFRAPNPNSPIPAHNARIVPSSETAFWVYESFGGYPTNTVVNETSSDFSSGYWPSQQTAAPGDAHMVSPGDEAASLADVDTDRIVPTYDNLNPGASSFDEALALSHGGAPGWPGNLKRKKRGLITRAPYYSGLAPTDENKGI